MKAFSVACLLICWACLVCSKPQWHQLEGYTFSKYVQDFHKVYASGEEFAQRQAIFEKNLISVIKNNKNVNRSWKEGVNHLTDRTPQEFRRLLGYKRSGEVLVSGQKAPTSILNLNVDQLPTTVDWRTKGVVSAVKDQGQCGSCWTFGSAETVESFFAIATGQLPVLSEQQILDCTPNPNECGGTGGCGGGTPELAYAQIIASGGLSSEWTYPYVSYGGQNFNTCRQITPVVQLSSYVVLPSNQYAPVMSAIANMGPLAINVDASAWSSYETGVFDGCNQTHPDIDHVVQLVGYGTDPNDGDYWIVRNSWSPAWGEAGYIRLKRHSTNTPCGTDLQPQDGTGCKGGPAQVTVCGTCAILYDVSYPIVNA